MSRRVQGTEAEALGAMTVRWDVCWPKLSSDVMPTSDQGRRCRRRAPKEERVGR